MADVRQIDDAAADMGQVAAGLAQQQADIGERDAGLRAGVADMQALTGLQILRHLAAQEHRGAARDHGL